MFMLLLNKLNSKLEKQLYLHHHDQFYYRKILAQD